MRKTALKIALSTIIVGGSLALVLYHSAGGALEYYKHVDEVAPARQLWQGKAIQLHGFVAPGSLERRLDSEHQQIAYRFALTNCGASLPVVHVGSVPDGVREGAEVVCRGSLAGDVFSSSEVVAKCPSKYRSNAGPTALCTGAGGPEASAASRR